MTPPSAAGRKTRPLQGRTQPLIPEYQIIVFQSGGPSAVAGDLVTLEITQIENSLDHAGRSGRDASYRLSFVTTSDVGFLKTRGSAAEAVRSVQPLPQGRGQGVHGRGRRVRRGGRAATGGRWARRSRGEPAWLSIHMRSAPRAQYSQTPYHTPRARPPPQSAVQLVSLGLAQVSTASIVLRTSTISTPAENGQCASGYPGVATLLRGCAAAFRGGGRRWGRRERQLAARWVHARLRAAA